jgi:hypothetical protein
MKHIRIIVLASITILVLQSCENHQTQQDPQKAYLHLQNGWNNDDVRIDIDGNEVYHNDSVLTNNVLGFADSDSTTQTYGNHEIKVDVNNGFIYTEHFDLHQTMWIGMSLNPSDSSLNFMYSTEPYLYD